MLTPSRAPCSAPSAKVPARVVNYYLLETTTFDDGSAFATGLNDFTKKVQFAFDTNMVVVGSPDITNVTMMRMDEVMSGTFGSSIIEDFRIDNLYTVYPDAMNFVYLTSNKGTDVTGATTKTFLDSVDDIPAFSLFCPDIIDVIAFRAAVILVPQIVDNADFRKMHLNEQEHLMTVFGKSWPRKRVINSGKWGLKR